MKQETVAGTVFIIIGLSLINKPDVVYKLTEKWKTKDGQEPADNYVKTLKMVGLVACMLGVFLIACY